MLKFLIKLAAFLRSSLKTVKQSEWNEAAQSYLDELDEVIDELEQKQ